MLAGVVDDFPGAVAEDKLVSVVLVSRILPGSEEMHVESAEMQVSVEGEAESSDSVLCSPRNRLADAPDLLGHSHHPGVVPACDI